MERAGLVRLLLIAVERFPVVFGYEGSHLG
jgi:hypothetical protein